MKKGTTKPDSQMHARYRKMRVNGKQVNVHRYVMEQKLGRPLLPNEVVHHINGNKLDNRPENLAVMSAGEHSRLENLGKKLTPEHIAKVIKSLIGHKRNLGKKHTPEHNAKISASLIGNQNNKGRVYTAEEREHFSETSKAARKRKFWSSRKR